jgi:hypothetical protein
MQPTALIASVLQRHGVQVDSSVFKGGRIRDLGLDYRRTPSSERFWRFSTDVNRPEPKGALLEIPIHTELVPFWRMLGLKRLKLHHKVPNVGQGTPIPRRWRDFLRYRYPRKLDFCRMTFEEMRDAMARVLNSGQEGLEESNVVVAIGHSKDFVDAHAIRLFLEYLRQHDIAVTTLARLFSAEPRVTS